MSRALVGWVALSVLAVPGLSAQAPGGDGAVGPARSRDIANAILHWVEDFSAGRRALESRVVVPTSRRRPEFYRLGVRARVLVPDPGGLSSFASLQKLVSAAEDNPSPETVDALLALASTGLESDMFDRRLRQVRDLGHFSLLRTDCATVWNQVHSIASTELPRVDGDFDEERLELLQGPPDKDRPYVEPSQRVMWRVAALRLLGEKRRGVFRSSIERCLYARDGRVRLAAAESLSALHSKESLLAVTRVLSAEQHPMVVVTLVRAMQIILNKHAHEIPAQRSGLGLRTALGRLGEVGWRADMAIVRLIRNHPIKEAIPRLIALMRLSRGETDPILKIVNGNASRFLGLEAYQTLRKLTGALLGDDPDKWEEFWAQEKDRIVVRRIKQPARSKTYASLSSGGSFYGIPVLGSDVVFILDTSGSMKAKAQATLPGPKTGARTPSSQTVRGTRLRVACRQTLKAVQGMPRHAKFSIVTFNDRVRVWNRKPVKVSRYSRQLAAQVLGKLAPRGGTNVFDALVHVLEGSDVGYGEVALKKTDEVFVLSDGQPSGGALTEPAAILEVVREINAVRQVRINTVFAGEGSGADFMKRLAEENGGVFVHQK